VSGGGGGSRVGLDERVSWRVRFLGRASEGAGPVLGIRKSVLLEEEG
jgi:hypothetical protein